MSIHDEVSRGIKAQALLDDKLFIEMVSGLRESILLKIEEAPLADREGVHELKLMLKLLKDLHANFVRVANDGKLAARQVEISKEKKTHLRGV